MKLLTYLRDGNEQLACYINGYVYDLEDLHPDLPNSMSIMLNYWEDLFPVAQEAEKAVKNGRLAKGRGAPAEGLKLMAPVPFPTSCRDGYAFRQHVAVARRNRKVDMIAEFDEYPVFYFTNHHSVQGPGNARCMPDHFEKLDFELECAVLICKHGRNIPADEADIADAFFVHHTATLIPSGV